MDSVSISAIAIPIHPSKRIAIVLAIAKGQLIACVKDP